MTFNNGPSIREFPNPIAVQLKHRASASDKFNNNQNPRTQLKRYVYYIFPKSEKITHITTIAVSGRVAIMGHGSLK